MRAGAEIAAPTPVAAPELVDSLESYDDDLAWIVSKYAERTGAVGGVLSVHHADARRPDLLHIHGAPHEDPVLEQAIVAAAAEVKWVARRRGDDDASGADWRQVGSGERALTTLSLPLAADSYHRIVLTTAHENLDGSARHAIEFAGVRLQPVLAGYFKLWLLNRAQRRRIDGLASALNLTDIAIFLLDGAGDLLFTNHAALGLLDEVDGLRRVGRSLSGTDVAGAVKLRTAIDHVIAKGGDDGAGPSLIVPLERRDGRPLIASVMPVEKPPRAPNDPTVVVYVFSPDMNVGMLLLPICQIYGLTPAETRLVGLLAEGCSVHEAAERMRVKVPTLRTYLKQVFAKTETVRQSDLVRLMMASLVRTRESVGRRVI